MTLNGRSRTSSVDPGVDFFRFANGGWLDTHPIPPGFGAWGAFEEVQDHNDDVLHAMLLSAADQPDSELDRQSRLLRVRHGPRRHRGQRGVGHPAVARRHRCRGHP